jgi:GcrA cell cycle regulator
MVWNEDTIRQLRDLWSEGHSTAEIGRRLGVSKNAIVGKAHRLDLDARPSPIRREAPQAVEDANGQGRATLPPLPSAMTQPEEGLPRFATPVPPAFLPEAAVPEPVALEPAEQEPVALEPAVPELIEAVPLPEAVPSPALTVPRIVARRDLPPPRQAPQPVSRRSAPSCCWPIGDPGTKGFRFCDDSSLPGKPYCDEHAKLAYVKVRDRREDAA